MEGWNGGTEEKSRMDEMEESPHCNGFDDITREMYQQKTQHMLDVMNQNQKTDVYAATAQTHGDKVGGVTVEGAIEAD